MTTYRSKASAYAQRMRGVSLFAYVLVRAPVRVSVPLSLSVSAFVCARVCSLRLRIQSPKCHNQACTQTKQETARFQSACAHVRASAHVRVMFLSVRVTEHVMLCRR